MRFLGLTGALLVPGLMVFLLSGAPAAAEDKPDDGFRELFNGKNFMGWKVLLEGNARPGETRTFTGTRFIVDRHFTNGIDCTGKPNGYLFITESFKNYVLRFEWCYPRPGDLKDDKDFAGKSGCLIHVQNPPKVWPKAVKVEVANQEAGTLRFLDCKELAVKYDRAARDKAIKRVGDWNTTEITCKDDGSLLVKLNGTEVASGKSDLTQGAIGFQSEGTPIRFSRIRVKELK
jgi:hypothetical protein